MASFSRPEFRLLLQLCFWLLLMASVSSIFLWAGFPEELLIRGIPILIGIIGLLSLNIYFLFPRYLAARRYSRYFFLTLGVCVLAVLLSVIADLMIWGDFFPAKRQWVSTAFENAPILFFIPPLFFKSLFFFSATISSSLIEYIFLQQKTERLTAKIQAESAASELQFLKSQINPHFLLNALNNIYGLSIRPEGNNSEAILQLSEMMRYVLYDCSKATVPVAAEIRYIQHYISLQQLKDEGRFNVTCRYPISTKGVQIAPMLLIPLVENAFKHSQIEKLDQGWISIEIRVDDGKQLIVQIDNSLLEGGRSSKVYGGIGLQNVRRRLELLYPQRHSLLTTRSKDTFSVRLQLGLKEKIAAHERAAI